MSKKKDKKLSIKINIASKKSEGEDFSQPCGNEITSPSRKPEVENTNKPPLSSITTEIPSNPKIVGEIPPWDDDENPQQDSKSKPPTITAEIVPDEEKFNTPPRITGEIPPWDDEE
ncbi:MAG: hypothetical protein AAF915_25550 [Cyanobacteria bacterium P01_D01_bin.50]